MIKRDLTKLLNPESVAIIGASRSDKKLGYIVLRNIIESGFKGAVYPVNPQAEKIGRLRCFPNYADLPAVPDLAIIAIPGQFVNDALIEVGTKGTKNVVVFSAGFKETGEAGKHLEDQITKTADEYGITILGPNCLGFVNNMHDINATFSHVVKHVGNLRFISQSGAIASSIFDWADSTVLGFSEFITLGNKANLSEVDILSHWLHNKQEIKAAKEYYTKDKRLSKVNPIGMYLESINDGEDFLNVVSQITLHDPVFLLKPGKSQGAKKTMQSHTGSIAGEDAVLDAALEQTGVIRCDGVEDLYDLSKAFSWEDAPIGPNVAIISNAGGPAVISADFIETEGLNLVKIDEKVRQRLEKELPRSSSFLNPVDVLGDALATRYAGAIDAVLGQSDVHALIVILTPQIMTEIYLTAEFIGRLSKVHKKPIICSFMGGSEIEKGERILNMYKIPSFRYPERAVRALGKMWKWKHSSLTRALAIKKMTREMLPSGTDIADQEIIAEIIDLARNRETASFLKKSQASLRIALNSFETNEILKSWNIHTPPSDSVSGIEEAEDFAKTNGWPVVLKISSENLLHKTESGGVIVNITGSDQLAKAMKTMKSRIDALPEEVRSTAGIQIQKQIVGGVEVILGVKKDVSFGHVLMFGAGGTLAEIIQDRNLKMVPCDRFEAAEFIAGSKVYKLLKGYRGEKEYAITRLCYLIEKISELALTFPEFEEFEINPVIVTHDEVWAVDGKAIITL